MLWEAINTDCYNWYSKEESMEKELREEERIRDCKSVRMVRSHINAAL